MWTRFLLAFSIATGVRAQQDPTDLLLLVESRITESLDRLPRNMCTETVDRSRFEPGVHSRSTACEEDPARANTNLTTSDRGSGLLVSMGAAVAARIVRIRQFYGSAGAVALEVKLETVDVGGVPIRLTAEPDTGISFQKPKRGTLRRRVELGTLRGLEDRSASFEFRNVRLPYLIGRGLESMWVTAAAP